MATIATIICLLALPFNIFAQQPTPYGNNPSAGHYINVGDAKLYYEIYGQGPPLVMLHGGVYGGIDEFEPFISKFAEKYRVICIATRGHGKSELGKEPMSWRQRSEDAYKIIRSITKDSVVVLGFSDGGNSAYKLAATHPELVKKMIVIGAAGNPVRDEPASYSPEMLLGQAKDYFEGRLKIMPEPKRWGEALSQLNNLYNNDRIGDETFKAIKCPTVVMAGEEDHLDNIVKAHKAIANSNISVIPGCGHVVFYCNFPALWEAMVPFLKK
jgi:pimeloyl-ACP methyl ester carboxylesterase